MKVETLKQKIVRYERMQKHYRCRLWEAEKRGDWVESKAIKGVLSEIEPYLEKMIEART